MRTEETKKFTLDGTLRYLYITLRNTRCLFMAIEFEHGGKKYRVDTPKEAIALQRELHIDEIKNGSFSSGLSDHRTWTADLVWDLLNGVGELQKKFLASLYNCNTQSGLLVSSVLVKQMGMDSEVALAGVLSGLSKQLRRMSIKPSSVYYVELEWKGRTKERSFGLTNDFRQGLVEIGWPDAWTDSGKKGK